MTYTNASFAIEAMMNSMYSAQEARWRAEEASDQQEYEIALRLKPGPIQADLIARAMGWLTYEKERGVVVAMKGMR